MIKIRDLSFTYPGGVFQLSAPVFDVEPGERVAVVGPSGSGKTTLLNLIAGIVVPDSGALVVDGVDLISLKDRDRRAFRASRIGFVFQDFALLDYLNARDNILYPCRICDALPLTRAMRDRAEDLAESVGMRSKLNQFPEQLSQGEKQRIAICRALLTNPRIVLADEATGNLDPVNKEVICDILFERAAEAGAALLAVTHDYEILPRFDRTVDFRDFQADAQ